MTQPVAIRHCLTNATNTDLQVAAAILMRTPEGRCAVSRTLGHLKDAYDEWHLFPHSSSVSAKAPPPCLQYSPRPGLCQPMPPAAPPLLPDMLAIASGPDLAVYAHNSCLWVCIPDFRDLQPNARVAPLHVGVAASIAGSLGAQLEREKFSHAYVADLRKQKKWIVKDPQTGLRHTFLKAEHAHKRAAAFQAELERDLPFAKITIPVEEVLE